MGERILPTGGASWAPPKPDPLSDIQAGDVVSLRHDSSGTTLMTVEKIEANTGIVCCVWFQNGELRRDRFIHGTLVRWARAKS